MWVVESAENNNKLESLFELMAKCATIKSEIDEGVNHWDTERVSVPSAVIPLLLLYILVQLTQFYGSNGARVKSDSRPSPSKIFLVDTPDL